MPNNNNLQLLEIKKRISLLEKNVQSVMANVTLLTFELERLRNVLASKDGFEDLASQQEEAQRQAAEKAQAQQSQQGVQKNVRRGPMSSAQGRTLKVINN